MSLSNCTLITLPQIKDMRGNLTYIENNNNLPFRIQRVYYLYGMPTNTERGGHAHRQLHQLIVPLSGGFDIQLDDGTHTKTLTLNHPFIGLYICPMIWRIIYNFTPDSICLVLASELYDENDYFREYSGFMDAVQGNK